VVLAKVSRKKLFGQLTFIGKVNILWDIHYIRVENFVPSQLGLDGY
jgi:hypothetical protein